MSKLWKCYNCETPTGHGTDFAGAVGKCPKCGADTSSGRVVQRAVIHFDPPHPVLQAKGTNRRACDSTKPIQGGENDHGTGEPAAVTCPACQQSTVFKDEMAKRGGDYLQLVPGTDFTIQPSDSQ